MVQQDRSRANSMLPAQPSRNELASFWLKTPGPSSISVYKVQERELPPYRHPLYAPNCKFSPAFTTSTSVLILIGTPPPS